MADDSDLIVPTLDTNVIVRLLVGDDPQQTPADQLILARASRAGALQVLTFDQRFSGHEGVQLLNADFPLIETTTID